MAQLLEMPKLSDTMTEGVLRKWQKKEGDKIAPGELVAEVETDKATMDFESFDEGVILKLLVADGATVPVGGPIAIIGKAGEDTTAAMKEAEERKAKGGGKKPAPAAPAPAAPAPAAAPKAAAPAAPAAPAAKAAPAAAPAAKPASAKPAATAPASNGTSGKILASPLARRLATDLGVDLRQVTGSGPGGQVVERDVQAAADAGATTAAAAAAPASAESNVPRADASLPHPLLPERRTELRPHP
jgi:pyruvate dehydrogenase E2 component (dihydrolipoamide acetyltransferase)